MVQKFALVTGACGFIGSHMVDYLLSQGYKVRATDLSYAPRTYLNPKAEFRPCDLTEKDMVPDLLKDIDVVFHLAAVFDFSASRDLTYKVNVTGTENLLEACRKFPKIKKIVIFSTGAFYDSINYPDLIFSERDPVNPTNNYSVSKLEQEKISLEYAKKYNLPVTIVRPSVVYGPRSMYGAALIILFIGKGQLSFVPDPFIPGEKDKAGATVHVLDVVRAAEFLSKKPEAIDEVYNVADDSKYSVKELFHFITRQVPDTKIYCKIPRFVISLMIQYSEYLAELTNKKPRIERGAVEYISYPFLMDNQKIKALGFELSYPDIKVGMKEVIDWYLKEGVI